MLGLLSGLPAAGLVVGIAIIAWGILMAAQRRKWWWCVLIFLVPLLGMIAFLIVNPEPSQQTGPKNFDG